MIPAPRGRNGRRVERESVDDGLCRKILMIDLILRGVAAFLWLLVAASVLFVLAPPFPGSDQRPELAAGLIGSAATLTARAATAHPASASRRGALQQTDFPFFAQGR
jgi:hypothetical protein